MTVAESATERVLRRVRQLVFGLAPAAALVLIISAGAPAGVGLPAPTPGQVVGAYFPHRVDAAAAAAARDPWGRIVVAGTLEEASSSTQTADRSAIALARFTFDGGPDSSFGSAGAAVSFAAGAAGIAQAQVVTPLAGGGLLVGGCTSGHSLVERYTSDGRLDGSFGSGGIVTAYDVPSGVVPSGACPSTLAVKPLADGTIVVVYWAAQAEVALNETTVAAGGLTLMRLNADGSVLSRAGYSAPEWMVGNATAYAGWSSAHVFADGSVLVAGSMAVPFGSRCPCEIHREFLLRRFLADGTVDTSFGVDGRAATAIGADSYANALAVMADGRIVAAGSSGAVGGTFAVARYRPDGRLDPSFGQGGGTATVANGDGDALAVGGDGSIFLGSRQNADPQSADLLVVKLDADGVPIASFGASGRATSPGSGGVASLMPDSDGGVTAAVSKQIAGRSGIGLARYTPAGALDQAFGTPSAPIGFPSEGLLAVAATGTLKIAAAGFADDESGRRGIHVVLVNEGLAVRTFGDNGEATAFIGDRAEATAVGIDPVGRIVAGGDAGDGDTTRWVVARFRKDGTLDPTFAAAGVAISPDAGAADRIAALAVLPDSRLLVLVHHGNNNLLFRLTANGSLDRSFGDAGRLVLPLAGANALVLAPRGDAVVAGDGLACVWIDPTGAVFRRSDSAVAGAAAAGIAVQHDGQLVIAGTTAAGVVVVRRETDGSLDSTFGGGVVAREGLDTVGVAVQRDGRIDVAARPRGTSQLAVARFLYTGRVDSTFGNEGLAETLPGGAAHGIALEQNGIVVAGTVPAPRGTDLALNVLYEQTYVGPVAARFFHVRPSGVARVIARGTQPAWSQTSKQLAYLSDDDGAPTVSVRPREGPARRLFQTPLSSGAIVVQIAPQWSPDGKLLAIQLLDASGRPSIAVASATGGQPREIAAGWGPAWLTHHRLAYTGLDQRLHIADADSGSVQTIGGGGTLRAAPHGDLLAVNGFDGYRGWAIIRDTGAVVRRLPARIWDVGWAPDGRRLAVFDRNKLAIIDLKGRERLLRSEVGPEARAPAWSPDGRLIAFVNRVNVPYFLAFVDARSGRQVGRWTPGFGFDHATPTWDRTGVYIPTS